MCPRGRPRGQGRPRGLHLCFLLLISVDNAVSSFIVFYFLRLFDAKLVISIPIARKRCRTNFRKQT